MVNKKQSSSVWTLFFALLSILAIGSCVYFYITMSNTISRQKANTISDDNYYKISIENQEQQTVYRIIEDVDGITATLDKVALTNDTSYQHQLLTDVALMSGSLIDNFNRLPLCHSDNRYMIDTFLNQLHGYTRSLVVDLSEGKELSKDHHKDIVAINNTVRAIGDAIRLTDGNCGMIVTNTLRVDGTNLIDSAIDRMDQKQLDYGTLEYNGQYGYTVKPGSITIGKALSEEDIKNTATKLVSEIQGDSVKSVTVDARIDNGADTYYLTVITDMDVEIELALTADGRLVQMDYSGYQRSEREPIQDKDIVEISEKLCVALGYDVKYLSHEMQDSIIYVTLVAYQEDIIVLSDNIVVAIEAGSGKVIGLQCKNYLMARGNEPVVWGELTEETARHKESTIGEYIGATKVIYTKYGTNIGCYKLDYQVKDRQYSVIIDSNTGKCIDIITK